MDSALHILHIPRAEKARYEHARAQGNTVDKTNEQHNEACGGTDRRESLLADKITDNQRIDRVIELLEQVAQENGNRKKQHLFRHASHRKQILIFFHSPGTILCDKIKAG